MASSDGPQVYSEDREKDKQKVVTFGQCQTQVGNQKALMKFLHCLGAGEKWLSRARLQGLQSCQLNAQPCLVSHAKGTDGKEWDPELCGDIEEAEYFDL